MHISSNSHRPAAINNPGGEIIQEILGRQVGGLESHSLAHVTIPPGRSSDPHFHKYAEESYYILEGHAVLQIDTQKIVLKAGQACWIEPNEVHQIFNQTDHDLIFLAICVPAWHPGDSFEIRENPA